jgi:hypothetical protein
MLAQGVVWAQRQGVALQEAAVSQHHLSQWEKVLPQSLSMQQVRLLRMVPLQGKEVQSQGRALLQQELFVRGVVLLKADECCCGWEGSYVEYRNSSGRSGACRRTLRM